MILPLKWTSPCPGCTTKYVVNPSVSHPQKWSGPHSPCSFHHTISLHVSNALVEVWCWSWSWSLPCSLKCVVTMHSMIEVFRKVDFLPVEMIINIPTKKVTLDLAHTSEDLHDNHGRMVVVSLLISSGSQISIPSGFIIPSLRRKIQTKLP